MINQGEFDFDNELPPGREFFPVRELAALWRCTIKHVHNLIDSGELETTVNLKHPNAKKSMRRVPRKSVVDFLNRRKGL